MTIKNIYDFFNLKDKVIVITGAGLIGKALITNLAKIGANVIIGEKNEKLGTQIQNSLKPNYRVYFKQLDITNEESIEDFIKEIFNIYKIIDGWINTAYPKTTDWGKKEANFNFESWKRNIEMHLGGYYLTSIKIAEKMKEQNNGSIINFSSIYGILAPDFSIYEGTEMDMPIAYSSIKGGINMLTKYIASKYGRFNIRANIIAPGGIYDQQPEIFVKKYKSKVPLGRMAKLDDIIGPVVFLLSKASSYITGHILLVDGGLSIL